MCQSQGFAEVKKSQKKTKLVQIFKGKESKDNSKKATISEISIIKQKSIFARPSKQLKFKGLNLRKGKTCT